MRTRETEVKLRVASLTATRRRLLDLGLSPIHHRALEDNFLFDTPERALRQVRSILRLRHYAGKWIVTFKGTPAADAFYKSRLELESEVQNAGAMRSIFQALGFKPVFRYQKYRTHYALNRTHARAARFDVALDETPIGNYLEIEGSRTAIDRVARELGYSRQDYITASYGALYLEDCKKKNIPPGDMIFAPSKKRPR
ncbi:MAG: class IV adenylate cyclase [Acidobacteria bacterium]|nr:class IV adenylate cyclase [Acidobacteriota bacterium]